jgi:uncharacterized membrane protein YphA (DoxX/SURF4 family)
MLSTATGHRTILFLRILLGLFFISSGIAKFWWLPAIEEALLGYTVVPHFLISVLLYGTPCVECIFGFFLLVKYRLGQVNFMLLLLVFIFTVAAFTQYESGQGGYCGCFGSLIERKNDWRLFAGNTFLMVLLSIVFYRENGYTD